MSYILQALEKSEQQRQQAKQIEAPIALTAATPVQRSYSLHLAGIAIGLVLLVVSIVWANSTKLKNSNSEFEEVVESNVVELESKIVELKSNDADTLNSLDTVSDNITSRINEKKSQTDIVETYQPHKTVIPVSSDIVSIYSLDSHNLNEMPPIIVSSHIYSSMPEYRAVTINGEGMIEGQSVTQNLRLLTIEKKTLIFEFDGQKISVPALKGWQP
jgi:hypothetical protein